MKHILLILSVFFCVNYSHAQITITSGGTATALAQAIAGPGIAVSNATINCATNGFGTFSNGATGAGNIGITNGVLLTTGTATQAAGAAGGIVNANNTAYTGSSASDPDLVAIESGATLNTCRLEFDLIPICGNLNINYVFASEEYPDYVCSGFNDAFAFFISGPGITGTQNMAIVPSSTLAVAINSVNSGTVGFNGTASNCSGTNGSLSNSNLFVNNSSGAQIEYGGFTIPLTASAVVQPCSTYHLKVVIADAVDVNYDSGVFLQQDGVTCPSSPVLTINPAAPSICPGQSVALTASGAPTNNYTWSPATGLSATTGATVTATPASTTTYVVSSPNGCSGTITDTVIVTVNGTASPAITPAGPFCTSAAAVNLTANPTGGTWSGTGITNTTNGTFNPATAGVGTHTITYTIGGACGGTTTANIVVNSVSTPVINPAGPFCSSASAVNLSATPTGGTWSGTGITSAANGTFDPSVAGNGTHTITYTVTGACGGTTTANITVSAMASPSIIAAGPFCSADPAVTLSASPSGGTWSGTGITNTTNGTFTPSSATVGTNTITYTVGGSCGGTTTSNITVTSPVTPSITAAGPFCNNAAAVALSATPTGGTWSGTGITNTATGAFNPATASVGTNTITYTTPGTCGGTATTNITVNAVPTPVITQVGPYCNNAASVTLSATPTGGTWSGSGITNAATGAFNPATASIGSNIITYNTGGACPATDTMSISVSQYLSPLITQASPLCTTSPSITLSAASPGGTWSGTGITNTSTGVFDPASSGAGVFTVSYSFTGICAATDTMNVTVNAVPTPLITQVGPYCNNAAAVTLSATPTGGTWSGTGITNAATGAFNPATASIGSNIITYNIGGACPANDTVAISVSQYLSPLITQAAPICATNSSITLIAASAGGTWSGTGITNTSTGVFDPASSGAGVFTVSYSFTGICAATDTMKVTVNAIPTPDAGSAVSICSGNSTTLTCTPAGYTSYQWTPAATLSAGGLGQSVTASPVSSTLYTVTATNNGCSATDTVTVFVNAIPVANFTADTVCLGTCTPFTNSSTSASGTLSYFWNYGDPASGTSNLTNPCYTYSTAGTYTVTLVATAYTCSNVKSKNIVVLPMPVANFTKTDVCQGKNVTFNNTSVNASGYLWSFGDSQSSFAISPVHNYAAVNSYNVLLTATNQGFCSDTATAIVNIYPNPTADFNYSDVCFGKTVTLTDNSTIASGAISNYFWDYTSDNTNDATTQNASNSYPSAGAYNITHIVSTSQSCSDTITKTINIFPVPDAQFTTSAVCEGTATSFVNNSTISSGTITSNSWNFGYNNQTSTQTSPSFTYPASNTYWVYLTVGSANNCFNTDSLQISVYPNPVVNFAALTPTKGCAPLCVSFNDLTTISSVPAGSIISNWSWNLSEGTSTAQNPVMCYTNPGNYSISLQVSSNNGCTTSYTLTDYVTVYPDPVAEFAPLPSTTSIFNPDVTFIDMSSGGQSIWWDFGDSTLSSISESYENIHHMYSDTGVFVVTQVVTSEFGCVDTFKTIVIIEPDYAFYIPNAFTINNDGRNDVFTGKGYGIKTYEMLIFDRWGNLIFTTDDLSKGWDGTNMNGGGEICETDVYVYRVSIKDILDRKHQYIGGVTLLK